MKKLLFTLLFVLPILLFCQKSNSSEILKQAGIKLFNDNSKIKPEYEGCGSYFSTNKSNFDKNTYVFTGMISDYFWGDSFKKNFNIEMVIDNEVIYFDVVNISKDMKYTVLKNYQKGITAHITLNKLKNLYESFVYTGTLILKKNGKEYKIPLYGQSGC